LAGKVEFIAPQADAHYLELELKRIDLLIRQAVRRWQIAGQDPADRFRGLYIAEEEATALAERPLASSWGAGVTLPTEEASQFAAEGARLLAESTAFAAQVLAKGQTLRLARLAETFHLSAFEYSAFLVCLAPALDTSYERLFGFLQDDVTRKNPGLGLVLDLLLPPGPGRLEALKYFNDQGSLLHFGMLTRLDGGAGGPGNLLRRELGPAPEIVAWLLGEYRPASELQGELRLHAMPSLAAIAGLDEEIGVDWKVIEERAPLLAFYGPDHLRQAAAAAQVASRLSRPLLEANLNGWKATGQLGRQTLRLALRDAALNGAVLFLDGWDCFLDDEGVAPPAILDELSWFPGLLVASSAAAWRFYGASGWDGRPVLWQAFDLPSTGQRQELWRRSLGSDSVISEADLEALAGQFALSSAQIQDAARAARNAALQAGRPLQAFDLYEAARLHSTHHLDSLAVKIKPRYHWQDIVLPADELSMLHEVASTVRGQAQVLDEWGLGKKLVPSRGVSALFAGQPGTGKTLAAQVIAAELGMDLYKIDLSTVVSKYIGETEKNLERIFSQAHNSNAILFFDEADAIFGKRSEVKDAHDRYANIEVGYLLQRMESYDGVVILATNLRSNLDEAFTRRLQFIVDFPFPDEAQRLSIWKVLFPPGVPCAASLDFETLARRFKLSGGAIRNTIVSAAFLAASEGQPVDMRHLLHGVRRELQKMGRLVDEKEFSLPAAAALARHGVEKAAGHDS
jgi:hypothetical protein